MQVTVTFTAGHRLRRAMRTLGFIPLILLAAVQPPTVFAALGEVA